MSSGFKSLLRLMTRVAGKIKQPIINLKESLTLALYNVFFESLYLNFKCHLRKLLGY